MFCGQCLMMNIFVCINVHVSDALYSALGTILLRRLMYTMNPAPRATERNAPIAMPMIVPIPGLVVKSTCPEPRQEKLPDEMLLGMKLPIGIRESISMKTDMLLLV